MSGIASFSYSYGIFGTQFVVGARNKKFYIKMVAYHDKSILLDTTKEDLIEIRNMIDKTLSEGGVSFQLPNGDKV